MNVARWTIGLAVIALGASPVLAQSAVQTAFNYNLTGCCEEPSCCCDEPSCCCDEPSCCCDEPSCCCDEPSCGCGEPSCCCDEPSCCCDEPSCCCDEPSCGCDDGCCGDACCGDACGCGSACGCGGGGCCLFGGCDLGDPCSLKGHLDPCGDCWVDFGMWTQIGYHSAQTPLSNDFGDVFAFNDVPDQINLHQQWLWFEKVADGSNGLDWGFRFDVMYGTDAQKTQAFGNDDPRWDFSAGFNHGEYGWAMPQAYLEVAAGDLSVIAGHFYTLVGYEVVTAPDNFFYSHALTMFNSEPFTHTGVLATYSGFDAVEFYGGWTLGWDTGFDQYTQNGTSGSSFLGGFSTSLTDDIAFTYICTFGDFGLRSDGATYGAMGSDDTAYSHSLVFDVAMSDNLNYVFQSDTVQVRDGVGHDQVGINQYLFYTLNDCMAVGSRMEWWKSDSQSFYETTFGLNYRPHANVVIRPEYRYDWTPTDGGYGANAAGRVRDNQGTFGIDMVVTY